MNKLHLKAYSLIVITDTISKSWQQHQKYGEAALKQQRRGCKFGERRSLSEAEAASVQQLMESALS